MKIVMPVAGKGSRLRPHTHATPKALIRVAGKPIIDYIIEQILTLDFSEMIFIIGHLGDQIRDYLEEKYTFPMRFIRQKDYNGLGHAIYQSRNAFTEDESLLVLLGDIIFTADIAKATESEHNMIGIMEVEDARKFGIVMIDKNKFITNMIEKPDNPPTNLAITGIYHFKSSDKLFNSIEYIIREKIKTRNEYQLTDAMKHMMYGGEKFQVFDVPEWYDCGAKESLLDTNEIMLSRYGTNDQITGNIIIPPVFVGKDCIIENSIVGPNVSLSNQATIRNSIVKDSILGIGSTVENTILDKSLIGDYAYLHQAAMEFNIGPDSEIIFTN